ncbi:MAG: copper chaperone PCu(A)C [Hyphomonadaceae bacterium]
MSIIQYGRVVTTTALLFLIGLFFIARAHADTIWAGNISVSNVFGNPTPQGADIAHVALAISNVGEETDTLIAVEVPPSYASAAGFDALPLSVYRGANLRRSQPVFIPGGQTRLLTFDGMHLVLYGIQGPFERGFLVPIRLTFEKAGVADVIVEVGGNSPYQAKASGPQPRLTPIDFQIRQAMAPQPSPRGREFACEDGTKIALSFENTHDGVEAVVSIRGNSYRLPSVPNDPDIVRIVWTDGDHTLMWSPGVRLMWMSGATHLMCGSSHHH